jgi:hypothetical protein
MHKFKRTIAVTDCNETNKSVNGIERKLYKVTVATCSSKTFAGITTADKAVTSHKVWESNGYVPELTDWKVIP